MKNDWLTASSFERTFSLLSAINTLSISAKLKSAGATNPLSNEEINRSRKILDDFFNGLQSVIQNAEKDKYGIVIGTDPRLGAFALQYINERKRVPPRSKLFTLSIHQLKEIIYSEERDNLSEQIDCLEALRTLIEQHAQTDVAGIFGDE
jgi:hypothetical protein